MENKREEKIALMETVLYLIERPAIYFMITRNIDSYYMLSVIVVVFTTAARIALEPEYLVGDIGKFSEKLGWSFLLERICILLFQFYAASGSIFCASIACLILIFTNLFAFIGGPIPSMLVMCHYWIDRKLAELQGNYKPMQDQEARQEVDTASQQAQAEVLACSDSNRVQSETVSYSSDDDWEVLDPKEVGDTPDPKSSGPSNGDHIKSVNEAKEEVLGSPKSIEPSEDGTMPPLEDCHPSLGLKDSPVLERHPILEKLESEMDDLVSSSKMQLITLLLEGDQDVGVDRKQVKEVIEYLLQLLLDDHNRHNNKPIEAESYREEDEKKKKESEHLSEEHDRLEEMKEWKEEMKEWKEKRKEWEEEWSWLMATLNTLKSLKPELKALGDEIKFLGTYYRETPNYYMSNQHQYLPSLSDSNALDLEYDLRELRVEVGFLSDELEKERRCSNYYKQQCDEYATDKKHISQAYKNLEEKYVQERDLRDYFEKELNANLDIQRQLRDFMVQSGGTWGRD